MHDFSQSHADPAHSVADQSPRNDSDATGFGKGEVPSPGDPGYRAFVRGLYRSGLITYREWVELLLSHGALMRGADTGVTVEEMLRLRDDPVALPLLMLELGDSLPPPFCGYLSHRGSDWLGAMVGRCAGSATRR